MIPSEFADRLPPRIRERLRVLDNEAAAIIDKAREHFKTTIPQKISFTFEGTSSSGDLITPFERAQSIGFVTRYDQLPENVTVHLVEKDGHWSIANFWVLRHVLNDFRPLIQNTKDAVYYARMHNVWSQMLNREDPRDGLTIRVLSEGGDITSAYSAWLRENKHVIKAVIDHLEFGYLYNGVLQHSDERFSKRFLADYASGELNYILWKHVRVLGFIRSLLKPYYMIVRVLTFPVLGDL